MVCSVVAKLLISWVFVWGASK